MRRAPFPVVVWLFATLLLCTPSGVWPNATGGSRAKNVVGRIEQVRVHPGGITLRAKVDTGAKTSSLDAQNIKEFQRDGESWVRFDVTNHDGEKRTIERRVVRLARIKEHGLRAQTRPVVLLGICLGKLYREVEVNLVDRRNFNYPLLIGRSYMTGHLVVDPELKYTSKPECRGVPVH